MATLKKSAQYYKDNPEAAARKAEYDTQFNRKPSQKRKRVLRNLLNRIFRRQGKIRKGDGNDVHHTGGTRRGRAMVMSASRNRAIR